MEKWLNVRLCKLCVRCEFLAERDASFFASTGLKRVLLFGARMDAQTKKEKMISTKRMQLCNAIAALKNTR